MSSKNKLPCLIILDINMPVMDGKETLSEIRSNENYKNIPVIIFSTSRRLYEKKFAENLDAEFVSKPVQYSHMERLVQEFVQKCKIKTVPTG
jgi:CheY-like chemotaxis protein